MSRRKIHIENLSVRLPKAYSGRAHQIAAGLGNEILSQTAEITREKAGTRRIETLDVGRVKIQPEGESVAGSQKQIARRIAALIGEHIK